MTALFKGIIFYWSITISIYIDAYLFRHSMDKNEMETKTGCEVCNFNSLRKVTLISQIYSIIRLNSIFLVKSFMKAAIHYALSMFFVWKFYTWKSWEMTKIVMLFENSTIIIIKFEIDILSIWCILNVIQIIFLRLLLTYRTNAAEVVKTFGPTVIGSQTPTQ